MITNMGSQDIHMTSTYLAHEIKVTCLDNLILRAVLSQQSVIDGNILNRIAKLEEAETYFTLLKVFSMSYAQ